MAIQFAYTGSYTTGEGHPRYPKGEGLHVYSVSNGGAVWTEIQTVPEINPAFIGFGRRKQTLYAAQSSAPGARLTGISAYAVDKESGRLARLQKQLDLGKPICCFSVHPSGRYMVAADFKGVISAIRLDEQGALAAVTDEVTLEGTPGPLTGEQHCSRPHHIPFDLDGNFIIIPDKGYDTVHSYRLDTETGKLERIGEVPVRPASCARHIAFHPNRKRLYVAAEFTSKVYVFDYDPVAGTLQMRQTISTERGSYCGTYCKSSEIVVHPNGRFLYVSTRGDNTIGIFAIADDGTLSPLGWEETRGETPRFFCLDDAGGTLFVGNQKSDNICVFTVDSESGALTWNGVPIRVPCPTWILFLDKE